MQVRLVADHHGAPLLRAVGGRLAGGVAPDEGADHLRHGELSGLGGGLLGAALRHEELEGLVEIGAVFSYAHFVEGAAVLDSGGATFDFFNLKQK